MPAYVDQFWSAWLATIAIEASTLVILTRTTSATNTKLSLLLLAGVFASASTLPYLWFVGPFYTNDHSILLSVGEPMIVVVEAIFLAAFLRISWLRGFIYSFFANCASFAFGLLSQS